MAALERRVSVAGGLQASLSVASRSNTQLSQESMAPKERKTLLERSRENVQMESLEDVLFKDEHKASAYLKDLISSAGLKGAWSEMASRVRHVQSMHGKLMALSSREALDRHYVKRAEYKATVEDKLATLLAHQVLRAETLEKQ
ncbi:unnamed protein product, partial [Polarella glacialis]